MSVVAEPTAPPDAVCAVTVTVLSGAPASFLTVPEIARDASAVVASGGTPLELGTMMGVPEVTGQSGHCRL
jgi:hypothetical protein